MLDDVAVLNTNTSASGDKAYGGVTVTEITSQNRGTADGVTRFTGNIAPSSAAAWYGGELVDTNNVASQLNYDPTREAANEPANAYLTPGDVNYPADQIPAVSTSSGSLGYTENQAATAADPAIIVTDADSPLLASASVSISDNLHSAEDVLAFVNTASITGSYNSSTGVLSLTGVDTLANYQAALRAVRYYNTSENPNTASRTVAWTVNDGTYNSPAANRTVTVTAVNDPPTIAGPITASVAHRATLAFAGMGNVFSVSDPDSPSETITLSATVGVLSVTGGGATVTGNGSNSVTVAGALASVNTVLSTLTYTAPATGSSATLSVSANDGSISGNVVSTVIAMPKDATSVVISNAAGSYRGAANLSATLTANGFALSNAAVTFSLNGATAGTATTNANGLATLPNVSLAAFGAGTYMAFVGASFSGDADDLAGNGAGDLTIRPAALMVTADDKSRLYGDANPALTAHYEGFVGGETFATSDVIGSPALSTSATTASTPGNYSISAAAGSLSASNYTFQFVAGTLAVIVETVTWTGGAGTNNWSDGGNWSSGTAPRRADNVVIDATSSLSVQHSAGDDTIYSLTLPSSQVALNFAGGSLSLLTDSTLNGTIGQAGTTSPTLLFPNSIHVAGATTVDAGASLSGNGTLIDTAGFSLTLVRSLTGGGTSGLTKTGNGDLILSAVNSYLGGTKIDGGTLVCTVAGALPDGSNLTIGSDAARLLGPIADSSTLAEDSALAGETESNARIPLRMATVKPATLIDTTVPAVQAPKQRGLADEKSATAVAWIWAIIQTRPAANIDTMAALSPAQVDLLLSEWP